MAKLVRKAQKVFGDSADTSQIAQFGSLKEGSPATSKDPDTIQALDAYGLGWGGALVGDNSPALEDDNAIKFLVTRQLAYLFQQGIAEWDAATTYYTGSLCTSSGVIYKSLVDDNLNNAVTDATKWGTAGGINYSEVTADTTMVNNKGYIANKASTACVLTLPATSNVGDVIHIVGKGATGWNIASNASATAQRLIRDGVTSAVSSSSAITLGNSNSKGDSLMLVCTVANDTWTVLAGIGVSIGNYFGDGTDGSFASTGGAGDTFTSTLNSDMIVKHFTDFTVQNGHTITTSNRCKGLLIYVKGNASINTGGAVSMTGKGAAVDPVTAGVSSSGLRIRRFVTGQTTSDSNTGLMTGAGQAAIDAENKQAPLIANGKIYTITRTGASGAAGVTLSANGGSAGNSASAGSAGQTGGGGSGSCGRSNSGTAISGAGGAGTCFSGGAGSGAAGREGAGTTQSSDGSSVGGAGSAAELTGTIGVGGGAGNDGGQGRGGGAYGSNGTGGLIILIVGGNLTINGSLVANGANGGAGGSSGDWKCGGGASGGGTILYLYAGTLNTTGSTITCNGGTGGVGATVNGGNGGAGSIQYGQINQ